MHIHIYIYNKHEFVFNLARANVRPYGQAARIDLNRCFNNHIWLS